jgi:hypothetical protein
MGMCIKEKTVMPVRIPLSFLPAFLCLLCLQPLPAKPKLGGVDENLGRLPPHALKMVLEAQSSAAGRHPPDIAGLLKK